MMNNFGMRAAFLICLKLVNLQLNCDFLSKFKTSSTFSLRNNNSEKLSTSY